MKKTKLAILFITVVLLISINLFAEKEYSSKKIVFENEPAIIIGGFKMTISDAIKKAIESNRDILAGSYDVAMADSAYEKFQEKYSIFLNADAGAKYQENPEALAMLAGTDKKSLDATVSIYKMFSTGTSIVGGIKHEYAKTTLNGMALPVFDINNSSSVIGQTPPLTFGDDSYHRPVLFAIVQQELLKNGFGYSERRIAKILRNATKIKREIILSKLSMVVVGVIAQYWDVVAKEADVYNANLQLKETKRVRYIIRKNVRLGLVDKFNNNYYNTLVAYAEANVLGKKNSYKIALRKFLSMINMEDTIEIAEEIILTDKIPEIKIENALNLAYKKRADYKAALLGLENAKLQLDIETNNNLPSVVASIGVTAMSQEDTLLSSYSKIGTLENPSIEARVKVGYPLWNKGQVARERDARYKLKQAKINLAKVKRDVKDDIIIKYGNILNAKEIYNKMKQTRIESERFYVKMLKNMRRGRLSAAIVKNGLDAMVSSRQNELKSIIYFNITLLQFDVARNMIFEKFNIEVDRYIPGTNKYKK